MVASSNSENPFGDYLYSHDSEIVNYINQYFVEHKDFLREELLKNIKTVLACAPKENVLDNTNTKLEDYFYDEHSFSTRDIGENLMCKAIDAYVQKADIAEGLVKEMGRNIARSDYDTAYEALDYIYEHLDVDMHSYDHAMSFTGIGQMTIADVFNNKTMTENDFRNEEIKMSYQNELVAAGLSQQQITIIENTTLERVMGDYFTSDEHYPLAPVEFLKEWEQDKLVLNGNELHIKDLPNSYLTMVDEVAEQYNLYPERIIDAIHRDVGKYIRNLVALMPTINPEYLPDNKMLDTNSQEKVDRAVEMLDEDYYAADILKDIHNAVVADNPEMDLNEQLEKSISILHMAEDKFYNQPLTPKSMVHEMYKDMKATMNDFKDMMHSINKLTNKGKAIALKSLHKANTENKAR